MAKYLFERHEVQVGFFLDLADRGSLGTLPHLQSPHTQPKQHEPSVRTTQKRGKERHEGGPTSTKPPGMA